MSYLSAPTQAAGGPFAYVPNFNDDTVSVIDTNTNTVVGLINVGNGPFGTAVNATGTRVYVTNYNAGTVSVINTSNNSVIATVTVGSQPRGVARGRPRPGVDLNSV